MVPPVAANPASAAFSTALSPRSDRIRSEARGREAGKIGGGNAYRYHVLHQLDARGKLIRGDCAVIAEQAKSYAASSANMFLER